MPDLQKTLILGAKGTLGSALVDEFCRDNYDILAWDRDDGDITSSDFVAKIKTFNVDIIVNATGCNAVDKAEKEEKDVAFMVNADAVGALANVAKNIGAVFVNYSTNYVFCGDKKSGYAEDDIPKPISMYGESKYEGEKNLQSVGGRYYIIRLSRLYGRCGTSRSSKPNFVDLMLSKKDEAEIKVVDDEVSSSVYAPDLARFTRELLEGRKPYGIYHGVNSGACSWFECAQEIFCVLGRGPKLVPVPAREFPRTAKRPAYSILLNTKMPEMRRWGDALKEYIINL